MSNSPIELLSRLHAAVVAMDSVGRIVQWNASAESLFGWTEQEAMGRQVRELLIPADEHPEAARARASLDTDGVYEGECELLRKDGSRFRAYARDSVIRSSEGEPEGYMGVVVELSTRPGDRRDGLFEAMFDNALLPIALYDDERRCHDANATGLELMGITLDEFRQRRIEDFTPPDLLPQVPELWDRFIDDGSMEGEWELIRSDGTTVEVEFSARANVAPGRHMTIMIPIDERRRAEKRAQRRAEQQAAIARLGKRALLELDLDALMEEAVEVALETFDATLGGVVELFDDGRLVVRSGAWKGTAIPESTESLSGYTIMRDDPVVVEDWDSETRFAQAAQLREHGARSGVAVVIPGKDRPFGVMNIQSPTQQRFDEEDVDALQALANVLADAIERSRSEAALAHQALHDSLTGLPNRTLLHDRLTHALARAERDHKRVAVLFVDVDNFKLVNETHGHHAGDELLAALAPRLSHAIRPSDSVARWGADEFVVVCEDLDSERDAIAIAERIAQECSRPLLVAGDDQFVGVSMGISMGPEAGVNADALIRNADTAALRAKERGRGRYELFDEDMRTRYLARLRTESELRPAIERGDLRLVYQPVVSIEDGALLGVEALARWEHPERGLIGPDEFIAVAEESGLIVPIGRWVLEEACRQMCAWDLAPGSSPTLVSVNVSTRQVSHGDLVPSVAQVLADTGIEPDRLALEITESVLMDEGDQALATLSGLKSLGVGLFLDDFGTGYSSLSYLKRFPIDALKIDRSFVSELGEDMEDSIIVAAVMSMARALGLTVVAEGVETQQQYRHLRTLQCRRAQGYFFAKPLSAETLTGMLADSDGPLRLLPPSAIPH